MSEFTLTADQQAAYRSFVAFITDPVAAVFVLAGYAGTGKSTLVNKLLTDLPATLKTAQLIGQSDIDWEIQLTATTNKACEALAEITGEEVRTIQSFLGLRPVKNHKTRETELKAHRGAEVQQHKIIFIDEASMMDVNLLELLGDWTDECKIVFIGDPAQLPPVKSNTTPVFARGYPQSSLTEVVRQANGNPIIDLATAFRNTVNGAPWGQFKPDQEHIIHLPRHDFEKAIVTEFTRPDWQHSCSKVLAWTNKTVIAFNQAIRNVVQGVPELEAGDYAVCNNYLQAGKYSIKTDQTVLITEIHKSTQKGVNGWFIEMDGRHASFMPASLEEKKARLKKARDEEDYNTVRVIEDTWADLRAAYACTINKSQGSTYDRVFIDLDDIAKCHSGNQIARLMYVAVSRARHQVYLTGDLA